TGEVTSRRQLAAGHPWPEVAAEMLEHGLDRLARHVRARRSLTEALGPRVVADTHDDGVRPAALGRAVAEGLDERDAERVQRRADQPHRRTSIGAGTDSRK